MHNMPYCVLHVHIDIHTYCERVLSDVDENGNNGDDNWNNPKQTKESTDV